MTAAGRYGYRGSKEILQFTTKFHEVPSRTRNEHTPQFLTNGSFVNEWVPPIHAAKAQTINGIGDFNNRELRLYYLIRFLFSNSLWERIFILNLFSLFYHVLGWGRCLSSVEHCIAVLV